MKLHLSSALASSHLRSLPDRQGLLYKKSIHTASYRPCWCELWGNILLCRDQWGDRGSLRLILLEGCTVELQESASEPHTFEISYPNGVPGARSYKMAAESQEAMEGWVRALSTASFCYLRALVTELEGQFQVLKKQQRPKCEGQPRHLVRRLKLPTTKPVGEAGPLYMDFAQLHQQFGDDILRLRLKWQEKQGKQQPENESLIDFG